MSSNNKISIIDSIQNDEESSTEEEEEEQLTLPVQKEEEEEEEKEEEEEEEEEKEEEDDIDAYFNSPKLEKKSDIMIENSEKKEEEEIIVGIDLGTTNSCIGVWRKKNLEIIPDKYGNRTIPSVIAFTNKSRYIGKEAKKQIELNPDNTFYEVKRLIGRKYNDETVTNDKEFLTYQIDKDTKDNVVLKTNLSNKKNTYTPEELSSMLLMEL